MISQTDYAGRTPTQRNTPPIETCLRVIVLSFVTLTLFAIPREGAVQPPLATRVIVGSGVGGQSQVRVFDGTTAAPLPSPLGSFTALTQNPGGEVRVAACDFNSDGTDDIIASPGLGKRAEVRARHREAAGGGKCVGAGPAASFDNLVEVRVRRYLWQNLSCPRSGS